MKKPIYFVLILLLVTSCQNQGNKAEEIEPRHFVDQNGTEISFTDQKTFSFFKTEKVNTEPLQAVFPAVGIVGATVHRSNSGASENIVFFENSELTSNYTELIQHQINISQIRNINIRQKQIEMERTIDLLKHGSATEQEMLSAEMELSIEQTNLANERAALIEHEVELKAAGYDAELLKNNKAGTALVISDIPESYIDKIKKGSTCTMVFTAFPNEEFTGTINAIADRVDNASGMAKVRIEMNNPENKLKSGMFANISFDLEERNFINVRKNALVTVQGKHYVFSRISDNLIERREIQIGQQIGERVIVFHGLNDGDEVVIEGVMQLKGLSFGY